MQRRPDGLIWATQTPSGAATIQLIQRPAVLSARAWGPGANQLISSLPALSGLADDPTQFAPTDPAVAKLVAQARGVHLIKLPSVFESLMRVILQQLVTFGEACRAWGGIVHTLGHPAPGPIGLKVPPTAATLARVPPHRLVPLGVLPRFARTLRVAAAHSRHVERCHDLAPTDADALLQRIPGIGPWTSQSLLGLYLGHADAVPTGDYHLPNTVAWALERRPRSNDAEMLRLLEPFRPHRMRLLRAIAAARIQAPRRGPRYAGKPLPR